MRNSKCIRKPSGLHTIHKAKKNHKLEMYKLVFDLMKHITTLSSGAIIIVITLVEKVFATQPPVGMLVSTLGAFCVSIVCAIFAMLILSVNATEGMTEEEGDKVWFASCAVIATLGFAVGIVAIAINAFVNL